MNEATLDSVFAEVFHSPDGVVDGLDAGFEAPAAEVFHSFHSPVDNFSECSVTRARVGWLVGSSLLSYVKGRHVDPIDARARVGDDWHVIVESLLEICGGDAHERRVFTELHRHGVTIAAWRYAAAELLRRRVHPFMSPLRNPAAYLCRTAQNYERRRLAGLQPALEGVDR